MFINVEGQRVHFEFINVEGQRVCLLMLRVREYVLSF